MTRENPRRTYRFNLHRQHLIQSTDIDKSYGLEIGAHDLPHVAEDEGNCDFADFRTTQELIDLADRLPGHHPEFVVPVNYDLRHGYQMITKKYDWIAASHVVEHVPDLIGWLKTLSNLLIKGGFVFLVIPDKRYTFDYHRQTSKMSEFAHAHQLGLTTPSYRQVFDHHYLTYQPPLDPGLRWAGEIPPPPPKDWNKAHSKGMDALEDFVDAHCNVFTPESFLGIFEELQATKLIDFGAIDIRPTKYTQMDFSVVMRKV